MKDLFLKKIRLSWWFIIFFVLYLGLSLTLPTIAFTSAALTIFSVNSFLYGFYISPILGTQKTRIEELHKIIRAESNAIFAMVLATKDLPDELRNNIQAMFVEYIKKNKRDHHNSGEKAYEAIITFCVEYKGAHHEDIDKLLEKVVANQQNRTMLSLQLNNKVYSNEWIIMMMLFSITLGFILLLDTGPSLLVGFVTALLCTGLSMLIMILIKLSTLTHKKAKQMWDPIDELLESHFYRVD